MASYPSIPFWSEKRPLGNGRNISIAETGDIHAANFDVIDAYEIKLSHPLTNSTDAATLRTFYNTNKDAENTITIGGDTWDFQFSGPYQESDNRSPVLLDMEVTIVATKQ